MYATIPVYYPSLEEAARKDEAALWCDSYNINMSCRNFIQDKAMTAFNTRELDAFIEDWCVVMEQSGRCMCCPVPSSFPIGTRGSIRPCLTERAKRTSPTQESRGRHIR